MATSLTELLADVYTLTNRPDLVGESTLAIRIATLKAHASDYFYKDLFETGVQFGFSVTQQMLEYKTLVPRWRALKYLRTFDYSTPPGTPGKFLEILTPESVTDSYSINKENVCYVAGLEINIRTCPAFQYFLLGCYVYPDVTPIGYSSWVADEMPMCIIFEAAAIVFQAIGFQEKAAYYRVMVTDLYAELKSTNVLAEGY